MDDRATPTPTEAHTQAPTPPTSTAPTRFSPPAEAPTTTSSREPEVDKVRKKASRPREHDALREEPLTDHQQAPLDPLQCSSKVGRPATSEEDEVRGS
eukprot:7593838-Pyramimonas_sp.AAC.1